MPEITTDLEILRQISEPIEDKEISEVAEQLIETLPKDALGLAAPQISIHKRIFIANLSSGKWVFVNPKFIHESDETVPSLESCLSIPNIKRRILRHTGVRVECDILMNVDDPNTANETTIELSGQDAFIVQHEYDHLNGVLIVDRSDIPEQSKEYIEAQEKRILRILGKRRKREICTTIQRRVAASKQSPKKGPKRLARHKKEMAKAKKQERSRLRKDKISVEIQERYKAEQEGLFKD